jgi:hypothetical protein
LSASIDAIAPLPFSGGSGSALSRCVMTVPPAAAHPPVVRIPG